MNKVLASTDKTYCVNKNCKSKDECLRNQTKYNFKENELYSFCYFNKENKDKCNDMT